jgi:hypothetical protein
MLGKRLARGSAFGKLKTRFLAERFPTGKPATGRWLFE